MHAHCLFVRNIRIHICVAERLCKSFGLPPLVCNSISHRVSSLMYECISESYVRWKRVSSTTGTAKSWNIENKSLHWQLAILCRHPTQGQSDQPKRANDMQSNVRRPCVFDLGFNEIKQQISVGRQTHGTYQDQLTHKCQVNGE